MLNGLRILVAEDEPVIALELEDILRHSDASVVGPCGTGAEARELAKEGNLDGAVLDLGLRDGDAVPVLEALLARGVPVIVYTGGDLPPAVRDRHPDLVALRKPVHPGRLLLELKRVRRRQRPSKAAPL